MIRDRGNIKWNAMMLPEHVKYLREWHENDQYVEKPELDEWALQELSEQLQKAFENGLEVELKIWEAKHIFKATGIIAKLDIKNSALYLEDGRKFPFPFIVGVTRYE
ncbi:YolD-like family protein [Lysinibacillus yapensis]|uniref:YolD-like family protein n=1 Tax=Ureibacillus yapensis TaxID=2304605 RepID=A0A396SM03_9BACL|nr:YolD-like family protein [Lysinibacillus yapensis]RHW40077.1 YolD-like family protein [Lysinibacillus yapensis]